MGKSLTYFLNFCLALLVLSSCSEREWYKKELTAEQKKQYGPQLRGGRVYYYQGSVPEQFQLDESFEMDSTDADLWREIATARLKRGIADEMYYYYGEAVKRKPEKWAGFRGYIYLYFYRDYYRAMEDFNYADELRGEVDFSQGQNHDYMRGICYYGLEDYQAANESLDKYINKVVEEEGEEWVDVYALLYKGLALIKLERLDEAMTAFDKALKYYKNLSDCFYHKARIYVARGQFDLAMKNLRLAEQYHQEGYYHQRPYVEVLEQIYIQDIRKLMREISTS
ncbi:tetratricopeptide repeat protein [Ekhidna sp. To15]|uniref:tetratricopeptide repeat protein n=1 Tax=Ekhidna sp. To15 TaxID=3395267 RepID=UPI003F528F7F